MGAGSLGILVHRACDMNIICVMLSVDMEAIKIG
jgi:hypothetical protein